MSRTTREAKLRAIYGDKYGDVLVTELGGRKRNRKKMLQDVMMESYRRGTLPSYAGGTITAKLPKGISYTQALDELLMGPAMDEASDPAYEALLARGADKPLHAAFFGRLAKGLGGGRIGSELSNAAGFAREGLQGLGNVATGGQFMGPEGFDPEDIRANWIGINRATGR